MKLLLIEDNERLCSLLSKGLGALGYTLDVLPTAGQSAQALQENRYSAMILDLGLPDDDGLTVLRDMRARGDTTPVIILTARGGLNDRVIGLNAGADDYLAKPFALEELVARIQALQRRPGGLLGQALSVGNVMLDTGARQVYVDGQPHVFSGREITVLEHLMRRNGRVVPKSLLESALYGVEGTPGSNTVEAYIYRLRKHLTELVAGIQIHTLRGIGYLLSESKSEQASG